MLQAGNGTSRIMQCKTIDSNSNFKKIINVEATWSKTQPNRQDNKQQKEETLLFFLWSNAKQH